MSQAFSGTSSALFADSWSTSTRTLCAGGVYRSWASRKELLTHAASIRADFDDFLPVFDEYKIVILSRSRTLDDTGYLFGSLIQHQLVDYIPLSIAIRYILDARRKQVRNPAFESRLSE